MKSQVRNLSFLLLLVSVAPKFSSAQMASYPPVTIPGSEVRTIKSTSTGRTYDLYIHKPADFDKNKDKKYPVLYLLDGQWDFKLLDSVVGGLVYDLNFLKTELIPFLEANYRGDPARRILGGHSLGGLFTLYAMFSDPSLFWGYLAGSPAIPWDNNVLVKQEEEYAKSHKDLPVRLYLAAGGAEPLLTPGMTFVRTLVARNYTGVHWDGRVLLPVITPACIGMGA